MHQSGGGATMLLSSLLPTLPTPAVAAEELKPASGLLELSSWCCWPPPLSLSAPMHKLRGRDEEEGSTNTSTGEDKVVGGRDEGERSSGDD